MVCVARRRGMAMGMVGAWRYVMVVGVPVGVWRCVAVVGIGEWGWGGAARYGRKRWSPEGRGGSL